MDSDYDEGQEHTFAYDLSGVVTATRILDNGDAGFGVTGWFGSYVGTIGYQGDTHYQGPGSGTSVASWTFNSLSPGQYRVSVTWPTNAPNRTSNAPYSILDGGTVESTTIINQQLAPNDLTDAGTTWENLGGLVQLDGTSLTLRVQLTDNTNWYVYADAVRIERVAPALLIAGPSSVDAGSVYTLNLTAQGPGSSNLSGWTVLWGDGQSSTPAGTATTATHTYTTAPATRTITATAGYAGGTYAAANSVVVSVQPGEPVAPSNVTATTASSSQVDLTWTDNSSNETGFAVWVSSDGGSTFAQAATVGPNVTAASVALLSPNTAYVFRTTAFNAFGSSGPSTGGNPSATTLPAGTLTQRDIQIANIDTYTQPFNAPADGTIFGSVLANDVFLRSAGMPAGVTIVSPPTHGKVAFYPNFVDPFYPYSFYGPGSFKYTPTVPGYIGDDTFTYTFTGNDSPPATVVVRHPDGHQNWGPVLQPTLIPTGDYGARAANMWFTVFDQTLTVQSYVWGANTREGGLMASELLAQTSGKEAEIVAEPTHGELTADPLSGSFTYDPDPGFGGWDTFTWRVKQMETSGPFSLETTGWIWVEPPDLSLSLERDWTTEGSTEHARLKITRKSPAGALSDVEVEYSTALSSAVAGDFEFSPLTAKVSFQAGDPDEYIDLIANDDTTREWTEEVLVRIKPDMARYTSSLEWSKVEIVDNDPVDLVLQDLEEEAVDPEHNETSPGGLLPLGGERQELELYIPEDIKPGTLITLSVNDVSKVHIYNAKTGGNPLIDSTHTQKAWLSFEQVPGTVYIEAIEPSVNPADITFTLSATDVNASHLSSSQDAAKAHTVAIDLDIDSNNDGNISVADDPIEAASGQLGKLAVVNDDDTDGDKIPDFADGYNFWDGIRNIESLDDSIPHERFTPIEIEISPTIDLSKATMRLEYSASSPSEVSRTGSGTSADPFVYTRPTGDMRIWTNGSAERDSRAFNAGSMDPSLGYYVPPTEAGQSYTAYDLINLGFDYAHRRITLWVESMTSSTDLGDHKIVVKIDPDGDAFGDNFIVTDEVRMTAVSIQYDSVWSDQLPGIQVNGLPDHTGYEGPDYSNSTWIEQKPYILMGVREDDRLCLSLDVNLGQASQEVKQKLMFQIEGLPNPTDSLNGNTLYVSGDYYYPLSYGFPVTVVAGVDLNNDGILQDASAGAGNEILHSYDPHVLPVSRVDYDISAAYLHDIATGSEATFPHASNFLWCFLNDLGLAGAVNVPATVTAGEFKYTHNVGAVFNAQGTAPINKAIFSTTSGSPLVFDIVTSNAFKKLAEDILDANIPAIRDWFSQHPDNEIHTFSFNSVKNEVKFLQDQGDADLNFAIGDAVVEGVTISATFHRKMIGGLGYLECGLITFGGSLTDLADFDYDADPPASLLGFSENAARVQAGYNTLGIGGHVFKIQVDFAGSPAIIPDYVITDGTWS